MHIAYSHGHQIRRWVDLAAATLGPVKRRKAQFGNAVCTLLPSPSVAPTLQLPHSQCHYILKMEEAGSSRENEKNTCEKETIRGY
ncbi:hypothetical protein J6590_065785 [Homalodisca vitripennis]|nr:hypothetical protein J6590_065785 [Homalodisca vitripennis]